MSLILVRPPWCVNEKTMESGIARKPTKTQERLADAVNFTQ
jgi:hypothetical protein